MSSVYENSFIFMVSFHFTTVQPQPSVPLVIAGARKFRQIGTQLKAKKSQPRQQQMRSLKLMAMTSHPRARHERPSSQSFVTALQVTLCDGVQTELLPSSVTQTAAQHFLNNTHLNNYREAICDPRPP